ncbi:MAG: hypothetical protein JWO22_1257 [Frankiales bacterium]|nr:hypothetical protein [Frankiales bacterium]
MTTTPPTDSASALEALLRNALAERDLLDAKIEPLTILRRAADDRVKALEHVYSLYAENNEKPAQVKAAPATAARTAATIKMAPVPKTGSIRETVREQVKTIIGESQDDAVHINSIAKAFETRGWTIPGQGLPANLTAHLSGSPDIFSPKRGWWQLGVNPVATKPKKRATKRTTKRTTPRRTRG